MAVTGNSDMQANQASFSKLNIVFLHLSPHHSETLGPPPAFRGSRGVQNVQNISSDTAKTVTSVARFDDARLSVSDAKNTVNDDLVGSLSHSKLASKNSGKAS